MTPSFNVLDQGWIPVVFLNGSSADLSIRQTLTQAHCIKEISAPSPLEEYSIYRLLGLFLMDALRPEEEFDIEDLYDSEGFDMNCIEKYISQCRSEGVSFDLFDEKRPFLQSLFDEGSKTDNIIKPVSALDCTQPSGNNHTHFNHSTPQTISPDKAIRLLLTVYWFCTAAAQGYPSGVYGAPPYFGVIKGTNLFQTLVSLLVPIESLDHFDDEPVLWRRTKPVEPKAEIGKTSWLQGMLFPTRKVLLIPDSEGNVSGVYLCQGENFINKETWKDPYVTSYTGKDNKLLSLCPKPASMIWRNYYDIIGVPNLHASPLVRLYQKLHRTNGFMNLTLYGVATKQAKYLEVFRHDVELSLNLAESEAIDLMMKCISISQQLHGLMEQLLKKVPAIPGSAVRTALEQLNAECKDAFLKTCQQLSKEQYDANNIYDNYCSSIFRSVLNNYDSLLKKLNLRARDIVEAEKKRGILRGMCRKLTKKEEDSNGR